MSFEDDVVKFLNMSCNVYKVCRNGTENTHDDEFMKELRSNDSIESLDIRHAPDLCAIMNSRKIVYIDPKSSDTIEKNAYLAYMRLHEQGKTIRIILRVLVQIRFESKYIVSFNNIENVKFIDSLEIVNGFPEDMRYPIDEDGWIAPRLCSHKIGGGSGTRYKHIDRGSMIEIPDFYERILNP